MNSGKVSELKGCCIYVETFASNLKSIAEYRLCFAGAMTWQKVAIHSLSLTQYLQP